MEPTTTDKFWDCECDKHFIKHSSMKICPNCNAVREDQPDSMKVEVLSYLSFLLDEIKE